MNGGELRCGSAAFLATGKHDLTGQPRSPGRQNDLVAFKMYFRLTREQTAALAGHVELILFPHGYAGLQPVEGGAANLSLLVTRRELRRCHGQWTTLLERMCGNSAYLSTRLAGATELLSKPLALSAIPYGYLRANSIDGLWRLGDQAAVIPSFSGDGMSIALHSAHVAAEHYLSGGTAQSFQRQMHQELSGQVNLATTLSRLLIGAPLFAQTVRFWPSLLGRIASGTRISPSALGRRMRMEGLS